MKKNLLLIGRILGGFVSGCIAVFCIMLCLTTLLGLTGCSMNVPLSTMITSVEHNKKVEQNTIEWIVTDNENRAVRSLDSVTFEIYRVPNRNNKYIFEEADYLGAKDLERGGKFQVPSAKDYNYEFVTQVRCIEFNYSFVFDSDKDDINILDYEGDIVMEVVKYFYGPIKQNEEEDGWTIDRGIIHYKGVDEDVRWEIKYIFLNENSEAMSRFYSEHKDGGRIVWNN